MATDAEVEACAKRLYAADGERYSMSYWEGIAAIVLDEAARIRHITSINQEGTDAT